MKLFSILFFLFLNTSLFAAADEENIEENVEEGYETPTDTYVTPTNPEIEPRKHISKITSLTSPIPFGDFSEERTKQSARAFERKARYQREEMRRECRTMNFPIEETNPDSLWLPEFTDASYIVGGYLKNRKNEKNLKQRIKRSLYGCRCEAGSFFNRFDHPQF